MADLLAGAHVVFPHVPGAGNDVTLEHSFAEWPALMKAGIVESKELAIHVEQGDGFAIHFHSLAGSRWKFCDAGDLDDFSHL